LLQYIEEFCSLGLLEALLSVAVDISEELLSAASGIQEACCYRVRRAFGGWTMPWLVEIFVYRSRWTFGVLNELLLIKVLEFMETGLHFNFVERTFWCLAPGLLQHA